MPVKVAIVTPVFPPQRGGIGKVAETDARQLAALGFDVTVLTPTLAPAPKTEAEREAIVEKPPYQIRGVGAWLRVGYAALCPLAGLMLHKYDAVLVHFPFFGAVEPLAFWRMFQSPRSRRKHAKLIVEYHMDVAGRKFLTRAGSAFTRLFTPRIARLADRVVATSFDYVEHSRLDGEFAAQPEHFRELAPAVDASVFKPGPKDPRILVGLGLPVDTHIVAFTGALDEQHYFKGIPVLLRAFAKKELESAHLLIIGDGKLKAQYQELAKTLGIEKRVTFAGSVPDVQLPATLRLCSAYVLPSTDRSEAFGIAALEAMACGLPVVSTDLPGVRTIVRHGQTGVLVNPGSASAIALALSSLLKDDRRREEFGAAARKMALEEYDLPVRQERLKMIMMELGLHGESPEPVKKR